MSAHYVDSVIRTRFKAILDSECLAEQDRILDALVACHRELTAQVANPAPEMIDPISKLKLPPDPKSPYARGINGKKVSADTFLKSVWFDYLDEGLLYAEHLRKVDSGLYHALFHQAKTTGVPFTHYAQSLGILTRDQISDPPPDRVRQVRLLSACIQLARATATHAHAVQRIQSSGKEQS